MTELLIVAAGGLAREVAAAVEDSSWELLGFLDDDPALQGNELAGRRVLGGIESVSSFPDAAILVCAGRGHARRAIVKRLQGQGVTEDRYATVVAPDVRVPTGCEVGAGSVLLSGTVLTADVSIGRHVVAMPGVVMTHDDQIADFATLCARVTLGGNVRIGESAYLGMGSTVRERTEVGAGSILGMGAVLLRDLPEGETWAGTPAQPLRSRHDIQENQR